MKRNYLVLYLITIQLILVLILIIKIFNNKSNVLGAAKINPIEKKTLQYPKESTIRNYYEPGPKTTTTSSIYGYSGIHRINNEGLNNTRNYEIQKNERTFRIITLGDSFTYGSYVDTKDNWPERLEKALNTTMQCNQYDQYEVLNLGVGGYDIEFASERFRLHGEKYNPDLVLWLLKADDVWQINKMIYHKSKQYENEFKKAGQYDNLVAAGTPYPGWDKAYKEFTIEYDIKEIIKIQNDVLEDFEKKFTKKVLFLSLNNIYTKEEDEELNKLILNQTKKRKNIYSYLLPDIYQNQDFFIPRDGHPTAEGYEFMTEVIALYIKENNIIPCN